MHDTSQRQQIARLLVAIEQEMRRLCLWEETPPPAEDLASPMPFCHDTLEFRQWLQWVFVQRMEALLQSGASLPAKCDIHPLAEHVFCELTVDVDRLLALILDIDRAITGGS